MYAEPALIALETEAPAPMGPAALSGMISRIGIPPCPQVLLSLMAEIRAEAVDFQRVVSLISGDVSLAAAMIKTANSPLFALRNKVQSVHQAVTVLGLKNVIQVVAGLEVQRTLSKGVSMERFWERSNLHAVVCSEMCRHLKGIQAEDAYTYGLFHDCGIPILMQHFPDYKQTLALANHSARPMPEVEFEVHATSHVVIGALLAEEWQLPENIIRAIRGQHDPILLEDDQEPAQVRTLIALSILADHLVARYLDAEDEAEWLSWGGHALEFLGIDDLWLDEIYPELAESLAEARAARLGH